MVDDRTVNETRFFLQLVYDRQSGIVTPELDVYKRQTEYRQAAIDAVRKLSLDVNIPQTLKEIGVQEEDLPALAEAAMADVCTGGNPRPCTFELVLDVYKKAF